MKSKAFIKLSLILSVALGAASCSYLDVVPVEQPDLKDMITDNQTALNNLYSCYGYMQQGGQDVERYTQIDGGGTDELVVPQEWQTNGSRAQWNALTPSSIGGAPWDTWYSAIGYCNLYLYLMDVNEPVMNPNDKAQYIAEAKFLKAYYHFRALQLFGPVPIIDSMQSGNIAKEDIPGRSHFDYCVKYIVDLLDEAAEGLPSEQVNTQYYGRATSVICKALKARVLLLAASPLYNGSFPDRTWKNDRYETPGYGQELVSLEYDQTKWTTAYDACVEAIEAAEAVGAELFDVEASELIRERNAIRLPIIPGDVDEDFQKRVMMFRYLMTATPEDGNKEMIWGVINTTGENMRMASLPHYLLKNDKNENVGGWGGASPTLYSVEHFYTKNGRIPAEDLSFPAQSEWFKSAGLSNPDIIKLNVDREARFYACISFDGDEYSPVAANRSPVVCEMRNPQKTGYDKDIWGTRNYVVTGFLNKKWVHPNFNYTGVGWNSNGGEVTCPVTLIRLGELYLNLAECCAHLGKTKDCLDYLNRIRKRAGVFEWDEATLAAADKTLLDAVMEERFVELWMEGQRYHDIRRYVRGREYLSRECYRGLNSVQTAPSFDSFNQVVNINQPFDWNDRMYLLPISNNECYSNPQMVQAPGY